MRAYSRFEETPPELVVELVEGEYFARGTRNEVSKENKLQNVLSILVQQPNSTTSDILEGWDEDTYGSKPVNRSIRNYLNTLLDEKRIAQTGSRMIGKTEAPTYTLINARKESASSIGDSDVKTWRKV